MYVQNVGPGDAGRFAVDIYGSCPNEVFSDAPHTFDGLAAGDEAFIRITFTFSNTGACSVGTTIDSNNLVAESNENNNTYSVDITSQ